MNQIFKLSEGSIFEMKKTHCFNENIFKENIPLGTELHEI